MYASWKSYASPAVAFSLQAIQATESLMKSTSWCAVNHFFLNFISQEKSDLIDTTFYLCTRNIIPLVYESLLAICAVSNEDDSPTMTVIKHAVVPSLLGIIWGKFLATKSSKSPLTWRHVIGMEILRKLQG